MNLLGFCKFQSCSFSVPFRFSVSDNITSPIAHDI